MRMARPGPGNGWRHTRRSGRPSSAPTARTSSLNSARSGSTSSKREVVGQPADVVVRLDRRRAGAAARLDHVGVQRALDEVARVADACAASSSKTRMNSAPMILRLVSGSVTPASRSRKRVLGVDGDERDAEVLAEGRDDLLALVLAHQAVVDEDAGELVADRPVHEAARRPLESTPPLSPQITPRRRPGRGCARSAPRRSTPAIHVGSQPQTSPRKRSSTSWP